MAEIQRARGRPGARRLPGGRGVTLGWLREIREIMRDLDAAIAERFLPLVPQLVEQGRAELSLDDARDVQRAADAALDAWAERQPLTAIEAKAAARARQLADFNGRALSRELRAQTGQRIAAPARVQPLIEDFARRNAQAIRDLGADHLRRITTRVNRGISTGLSTSAIAAQIRQPNRVSRQRATLIAVEMRQLYTALTIERTRAQGGSEWMWQTQGDAKVRDEHAALDGQRFPISGGPSEGRPGEPFGCRCVAVPVFA